MKNPIVYIMACRIGPFMNHFVKKIHALGGKVYLNPDGHEWMRAKWSAPVRKYWKESERMMVKYAELSICDSKNIEKYIQEEYAGYKPKTIFIAYGSETTPSTMKDDDPKYISWLDEHGLREGEFYISVGRFVPENNFETMIREFMKSHSTKDFAIITTKDEKFLNALDEKLHFSQDKRIKFVGTVYDQELLKKIRERAYGYFHGHSVGGTNPSLLEALGSTKLNLLYDVGFNREVAEDGALYWTLEDGNLAKLIDQSDSMDEDELEEMGQKAKQRIKDEYIDRKDIRIYENKNRVEVNGIGVKFTRKEYEIIKLLAKHPDRIYTLEVIYSNIWEELYTYNSGNTVMVHIKNIRNKFYEICNRAVIETIWGKGYKFEK